MQTTTTLMKNYDPPFSRIAHLVQNIAGILDAIFSDNDEKTAATFGDNYQITNR